MVILVVRAYTSLNIVTVLMAVILGAVQVLCKAFRGREGVWACHTEPYEGGGVKFNIFLKDSKIFKKLYLSS